MLPPLNDVIDVHSEHLSTARRHVPKPILIVIIVTAAIGMAMIGIRQRPGASALLFPEQRFRRGPAASLWMTIDLDRPRHGLVRASEQPYMELLGQSMK